MTGLTAIEMAKAEAALKHSVAGRFGIALETVTRFAGFDWRTNIALVGGFAAKEVVVSTLGTAYSLGDVDPESFGSLSDVLAKSPGWNPVTAFSLIIFTIFYARVLWPWSVLPGKPGHGNGVLFPWYSIPCWPFYWPPRFIKSARP